MFSKFDTNPQSDELTAADIYAMREEFRQEEQELAEIADAQWQAFQDDHEAIAWEEGMRSDELYDEDELDEHDMRVAQAEWEAEMNLENDLYMVYDDPDYWD